MARILIATALLASLAGCDRRSEARPRPTAPPGSLDAAATVVTPPPLDPTARHRHLTDAEIAMVRPLFQGAVDYAAVLVIDGGYGPDQPADTYRTPEGSIYAPGELYELDYAASSVNPYRQAVFVHEIAHVWQFQNGMDMVSEGLLAFASNAGAYEQAYPYTLAAGRDLLDYGLEQEASILEDHFLIQVHRLPADRLENAPASAAERDGLYADVLGAFLADPTYLRRISAAELIRRHQEMAEHGPIGPPGCEAEPTHDERHLCDWRFEPR